MYFTSSSLSYVFLGMTLIAAAFFLYFKSLVIKTSSEGNSRDKIMGNMKNSEEWRFRNSNMANLSGVWAIISLIVFIYLKFFYTKGLINMLYFFIYVAVEVISIIAVGSRSKKIEKANP